MQRREANSTSGVSSTGIDDPPDTDRWANETPSEAEKARVGSNPRMPATGPHASTDYTFDNLTGWRQYRVLRPCRGMYHDIRRRLPYYGSDISDAFTYRTFASTVRMYFVKLGLLFLKYLEELKLTPSKSPSSTGLYAGHEPPDWWLLWRQRITLLIRISSNGVQYHQCAAIDNRRYHWIDLFVQLHDLRYYQDV